MKKRVLSLILAAVLVCALAVPALAEGGMGKVGEYPIISCGQSYSAAIDENSTLWVWGSNLFGQLGNGGGGNAKNMGIDCQTVPIKVLDNVVTVSCGGSHTAAIKIDGTLWTWGNNSSGQLGGKSLYYEQVKVMDDVAAVSCGTYYTAAIKTDGTLWVWGSNYFGQLGNGGTGNEKDRDGYAYQTVPVKVLDDVAAVSCGSSHTAAIKTDGTLWMWGWNKYGELGNGGGGNGKSPYDGSTIQTVPVKVLDNVAAVSCGSSHTAAIKTDGTLWMWGRNRNGELGNGTNTDSSVPVKVLDNVATVSCGGYHTAVIRTDGTLWMWGLNEHGGQLGNGTTKSSASPVKVMEGVAAVSGGYYHTAAVKTDGTLWMWGRNKEYQLGNGGDWNAEDGDGCVCQTIPVQIILGGGVSMSKGVRLYLNGGAGGGVLWTDSTKTIKVPTNPTKPGYTFGGWYTDAALTIPWNFNNKVVNTLTLYAKWVPVSSTATTTGKSQSVISLNGKSVTLDAYTLKAANGGDVTYVKLRDIAALLENSSAKFNVDWKRGAIYVSTKTAYTTKNGSELKAISGTDGSYKWNTAPVLFDGTTKALEGIVITDGNGGGHTFFKLRDLGEAIGFTVGWSAEKGIYIETK